MQHLAWGRQHAACHSVEAWSEDVAVQKAACGCVEGMRCGRCTTPAAYGGARSCTGGLQACSSAFKLRLEFQSNNLHPNHPTLCSSIQPLRRLNRPRTPVLTAHLPNLPLFGSTTPTAQPTALLYSSYSLSQPPNRPTDRMRARLSWRAAWRPTPRSPGCITPACLPTRIMRSPCSR